MTERRYRFHPLATGDAALADARTGYAIEPLHNDATPRICQITTKVQSGLTRFIGVEGGDVAMRPEGRVIAEHWSLLDADSAIIGTLHVALEMGGGWTVRTTAGETVLQTGDQRLVGDDGQGAAPVGYTDCYALLREGIGVGTLAREISDTRVARRGGLLGKLGRLSARRDWVLTLHPDVSEAMALAAAIMVLEVNAARR